jgi:hypothetical protein
MLGLNRTPPKRMGHPRCPIFTPQTDNLAPVI